MATRYYAVAVGRAPGIYTDYADALASYSGFGDAVHARFDTRAEAEGFMRAHGGGGSDAGGGPSHHRRGGEGDDEKGEGEGEGEEGAEEEERGGEGDSDSVASWDDGGGDPVKAEAVAPGAFMLSVYESSQRSIREQNERGAAAAAAAAAQAESPPQGAFVGARPPALSAIAEDDDGYFAAPSSAQQQGHHHHHQAPSIARPPPPPPPRSVPPGPSSSFFTPSQNFKPDASAPFDDEFGWFMSSQGIAPRTAEYARQRTRAIAHEIKFHYSQPAPPVAGDDDDDDEHTKDLKPSLSSSSQEARERGVRLRTYQNMCRATRLPAHATVEGCVRALRTVLVNIVDYIDAARQRRGDQPLVVETWDDFERFRAYTLGDPAKRIDPATARADGFLHVLLRRLRGPGAVWPDNGGAGAGGPGGDGDGDGGGGGGGRRGRGRARGKGKKRGRVPVREQLEKVEEEGEPAIKKEEEEEEEEEESGAKRVRLW